MAISNIPTFVTDEIPSAAKLNQLGTAITTKFSGGVTGADLVWPLVAQGNIDMNGSYSFVNLRTLWSVVNVSEYDTFADAVAALPTAGGCLFIPPGTTVTTDGNTVSKAFCVMGAGKTSVLKLTASATSGYLVRTGTSLEGVDFVNLTIDGNAATGSGQDGIQIRQSSQVNIVNCWFKNFSGDPLYIGNDGTGGNNSAGVRVHSCHFEGGSGRHVFIEDVDGLDISGCTFENPTTICIEGTPTDTSAKMRSIRVHGNEFSNCSQFVDIKGASATANDLWRLVSVCDNDGLTCSGDGITVGDTSAIVKSVRVCDNTLEGVTGDGIVVLAQNGRIADNEAPGCGGDGLDMTDCQDCSVQGNNFANAGTNGIDATNSDDCFIKDNTVTGFGGGGESIVSDGTTGNRYIRNTGDPWSEGASYNEVTAAGAASGTSGTFSDQFTVPAGRIAPGTTIVFSAVANKSGVNGTATLRLNLGGTALAEMSWINTDAGLGVFEWRVTVDATTGANTRYMEHGVIEAVDSQTQHANGSPLTVDWTADVTVDIDWTKNTSDSLEVFGWGYEIEGAV